jgi:hypothetical protein
MLNAIIYRNANIKRGLTSKHPSPLDEALGSSSKGDSFGVTLEGDRLILARHSSPKSDDIYFKNCFKVPVIPRVVKPLVKESPSSVAPMEIAGFWRGMPRQKAMTYTKKEA